MKPLIGGEYLHVAHGSRVEVVDFEVGDGGRTGRLVVRPLDLALNAFIALPGDLQDESGNALESHCGEREAERER